MISLELIFEYFYAQIQVTKKYSTAECYDAVSDVVESGVHWRSDFQIGSRVLKISFKPIFMHIYDMKYDFMHRSC